MAARGTTNHPPKCDGCRQRLRPRQQPKRQGAQRSTWRKSVLVRPAWQQARTVFFCFGCSFLAVAGKDFPNIIVIMMVLMIMMILIMIILMITNIFFCFFFDWTHVLDIARRRDWHFEPTAMPPWAVASVFARRTCGGVWEHRHEICRDCCQGSSGDRRNVFFQRFENAKGAWRFVGSIPPTQDSRYHQDYYIFRFGNLNLNPHLPPAVYNGGFLDTQAATKSAAASGLPPYQAVEPTATAAARWTSRVVWNRLVRQEFGQPKR